jgi:hypothetical protein
MHMALHAVNCDLQACRKLFVAQAIADQLHDLTLTPGELHRF